jgi:hypothetical protein
MDSDVTTLRNALAVLRRQYGEQLAGPQRRTEAQMRHTLQEQMGLDEITADRVLIKLRDTGRLMYVGSAEVGTEPGTTTTGPVISMPGTQTAGVGGPLITTAAPDVVMGIVTDQDSDVSRRVAENNEGATMGQLGDTNVEAAPTPVTIGEREEVEADRTHGYWRIGQ